MDSQTEHASLGRRASPSPPARSGPRGSRQVLTTRLSATGGEAGASRVGGQLGGDDLVTGGPKRARVLVVEDDPGIRESLEPLLEDEGYEVLLAENGREALARLHAEATPPDIIMLDLKMPVMDGWEFRAIQKDDPRLGQIPVVALSADRSAQAAAISAQAYLRKPVDANELMRTIERVLSEAERRRMSVRLEEAERLASLGRLAAGVGHEINNPLSYVILNVGQSLEKVRRASRALDAPPNPGHPGGDTDGVRSRLAEVTEMLEDCEGGLERIRETVGNLQRLSRQNAANRGPVDLRKLLEQSISMAWNQIRHRARLVKVYAPVPPIRGNAGALGQVFLNLLVNAAQAIPEGDTEGNEIHVSTEIVGDEVVVGIADTGKGISPEILPHVFEPFFTTKPMGVGTGLGLSISRQTVSDHGGRLEVESAPERGSVFRVFLPRGNAPARHAGDTPEKLGSVPLLRRRVLVIDDEPLIGRVIRSALSGEHDVVVVERAAEALERLGAGETFDLLLCDVLMPDVSGPEVYAAIAARWPWLVRRLVFMTGGAFTPSTIAFMERVPTRVLSKPFTIAQLRDLLEESPDEAA